MKRTVFWMVFGLVIGTGIHAQVTRGTPSQLRVRVDANGSIVTTAAAQVSPITSVTFNNARLAIDSSGNLQTVISGGSGVGTVTNVAVSSPLGGGPITTTGTLTCSTCAITTSTIGQFATTNSATLAGIINNETGFSGATGLLVFNNAPTIDTPTFTTNATVPLVIGGTGTTSTLTLKTTTGVGTTNADMIFVGGNNGDVEFGRFTNGGLFGVGTLTLATGIVSKFHVVSTASSGAVGTFDSVQSSTAASMSVLRHARGTPASLTKTLNGDGIGIVAGRGYQETSTAFATANNGSLEFVAIEDFTSTAQGTSWQLKATPVGSVTPAITLKSGTAVGSFVITGAVAPASSGTRFLCISTAGVVSSSAAVCSGT